MMLVFQYLFILCALSFILYANSQLDILRPKTVRIYQFKGKCPGYEKAPLYLKDIKIALVNRRYYISLKIVSTKAIAHGVKLNLILNRCQTRDSLDSCEKYQAITVNRLCDLLNGENTPWSPFSKLVEPKMGCPIKKGIHVVNNGTFDGSAFQHWPISGWYWRIMAQVLDEETNDLVMCMSMEGQLAPV